MVFKNIINTTPDRTFNEFVAFLGFFSKKSVPHFVKLLSHVKHQKRIAALRSRIAYIVQDDPSPITAFLNDPDVKTVVNAIAIIGLMKLQKAPTLLRPLLNHPSPFVRIEIISVFEKVGKPSMIAKFIDDEGSQVRIKALQTITRIRYPRIYPELLRRIKNRAFYDLEFVEQKEFFNCLVANGGREVTKELKKMLYKWFLFGRKRYIITRKLAAMALANVASEEALKILQKGFKKRNKDIKAACQMALKQT
jgi:HEAT repeat protein